MAIQLSVTNITPTLAKKLLSKNTVNRPVRNGWVDTLERVMQDGKFVTTHQGIALADDGSLLDGQHRLMAIAKSGIAQKMVVASGVPAGTFIALDQGERRTLADIFHVPPFVSQTLRYAASLGENQVRITADLYEKYAATELNDKLGELHGYCSTTTKIFSSAPMRLAACLRAIEYDATDFVFGQYRAMVLHNFDDQDSMTKAFVKHVMTQGTVIRGVTTQNQLLMRGMKVFHPKKRKITAFKMVESEMESMLQEAKELINMVLP